MREFSYPTKTQKRVVVGDIHRDIENLWLLLEKVEAIDRDGNRNPDVWLACVGDLIHGGHNSEYEDNLLLNETKDWFDCILMGNHEFPFLYPHRNNSFAGMSKHGENPTIKTLFEMERKGHFKPCIEIDGWLVSHAGIDPRLLTHIDIPQAKKVAAEIEQKWKEYVVHKRHAEFFEQTGHRRGGPAMFGGIFWNDWQELLEGYQQKNIPLKQLVGHTPQNKVTRSHYNKLLCIDVGARLSGDLALAYKQPAAKNWDVLSANNLKRSFPIVK